MRQRLNNCMVTCNTCFGNYRCYFCISCLVDLLQFSALRGGSPRSKHHNLYRLWSLNGSLDHHRHSILECRVSDALLRQFIDSVRTWSSGEFFISITKFSPLTVDCWKKFLYIFTYRCFITHALTLWLVKSGKCCWHELETKP